MKAWMKNRELLKLIGAVLLVPCIAWGMGFRQTYQMWSEVRDMQNKLEFLYLNMNQKESVSKKERMGEQILSNGIVLERLGKTVKKNRISIVKYTPFLTREEGNLQVYTGELVLSGGFVALLQVMHEVENDKGLGKIVSATFQAYQDKITRKKEVRMILVIQQLSMS